MHLAVRHYLVKERTLQSLLIPETGPLIPHHTPCYGQSPVCRPQMAPAPVVSNFLWAVKTQRHSSLLKSISLGLEVLLGSVYVTHCLVV